MFYIFWRALHPALFLKVKNAPFLLLKVKIVPCPFLKVKNAPFLLLKVKIAPCPFLEVKNAPCLSKMKNNLCPFSTIN